MLINFASTQPTNRYKLMSQSIVPRPIAWVITEDKILNIAPFSFYNAVTSDPPTLMIAVGHKSDGTPKDTLKNIRTTGRCTICSVNPEAFKAMHYTSAELNETIDEAAYFEIDTTRILPDYPPIVTEAPTAFFCTLNQEVPIEGSKIIPLFLTIEQMHIDDTYANDTLDFDLNVIARKGRAYATLDASIPAPDIPRKRD